MAVLGAWLAERAGLPADRCTSPDAAPHRAGTLWNGASPDRQPPPRCPAQLRARRRFRPTSCVTQQRMRLLNAGVHTSVIALWMGHVNVATMHVYVHADLALKERAIVRAAPQNAPTAAISRPTLCWHSSTACDHAEYPDPALTTFPAIMWLA